jgi:hypothetical protein
MNVKQLREILARLPDDASIELPDGSMIDDVFCTTDGKRAMVDTEDAAPNRLHPAWKAIEGSANYGKYDEDNFHKEHKFNHDNF